MKTKQTIFVYFFLLVAFCIHVNAQVGYQDSQIIYTDVNPDITKSTPLKFGADGYNIDLNKDGIIDFQLQIAEGTRTCPDGKCGNYFPIYGVTVVSFGNNMLLDTWMGQYSYPKALNYNSVIGSLSQSWVSGSFYQTLRSAVTECGPVCGLASYTGLWNGGEYYLGVNLVKGAYKYFGWIRLTVNVTQNAASFTLKDFAYSNIPGHSIKAGQKSGMESDNSAGASSEEKMLPTLSEGADHFSLNCYPNPLSNSTTISVSVPQKEKISLRIFDLSGKIVATLAEGELVEGSYQYEWNATNDKGSTLAAGVYTLSAVTDKYSENRKIIISR